MHVTGDLNENHLQSWQLKRGRQGLSAAYQQQQQEGAMLQKDPIACSEAPIATLSARTAPLKLLWGRPSAAAAALSTKQTLQQTKLMLTWKHMLMSTYTFQSKQHLWQLLYCT